MSFLKSQGGWYIKNATKNGEPRTVPLWGVFLEAVETQLALRKQWSKRKDWNPDPAFADLLFLQPGGKVWTRRQDTPAWHEFVGPGIRGHLARHVTGLILAEEGISIEGAKYLLGHRTDLYAEYYRIESSTERRKELLGIAPRQAKKSASSAKRKKDSLYMVK